MGEIDTKSIESVQAALCFFGEKNDLIKSKLENQDECEKEKELEGVIKDLANCKVQLEAKESAHKQALFDLAHYQKISHELSALLEISDFERDIYINDCKDARKHLVQLESKLKQVSEQLSESVQIQDQLSQVKAELKLAQGELLTTSTQLVEAKQVNLEAMTQAEMMESALNMEKMRTEELVRHLSDHKEIILHLKISAFEVEKEKSEVISQMENELESAKEAITESQEQLISLRNELEIIENLESLILEKSLLVDYLQSELNLAKDLLCSAEVDACDAIDTNNTLKADLESRESELEKIKSEISERETEAQIEIAILKSELHKGRSRIAAAEAAEERAKAEKAETYTALHQLALEAEEAKKETRQLKEESNTGVTISFEEYEELTKNANAEPVIETNHETESLKKELESATVRIGELRTRAEQAASRAEAAETAKYALEELIRKWKRQKEKRNAALATLREESVSREKHSFTYDDAPKPYQPLGKVLNMKF
jgi:hypothetical protein